MAKEQKDITTLMFKLQSLFVVIRKVVLQQMMKSMINWSFHPPWMQMGLMIFAT